MVGSNSGIILSGEPPPQSLRVALPRWGSLWGPRPLMSRSLMSGHSSYLPLLLPGGTQASLTTLCRGELSKRPPPGISTGTDGRSVLSFHCPLVAQEDLAFLPPRRLMGEAGLHDTEGHRVDTGLPTPPAVKISELAADSEPTPPTHTCPRAEPRETKSAGLRGWST